MSAEVKCVAGATEFAATVQWFMTRGWVVTTVFPADSPRQSTLNAYGITVCIHRSCLQTLPEPPTKASTDATSIIVNCPNGKLDLPVGKDGVNVELGVEMVAPNGSKVMFLDTSAGMHMPARAPSFVLSRRTSTEHWEGGRAGMQYRDLIPGRQGGRYIASHIKIPTGGSVLSACK